MSKFTSFREVDLELFPDPTIKSKLRQLITKAKHYNRELESLESKKADETIIHTCRTNFDNIEKEILELANSSYKSAQDNVIVDVPEEKPKDDWTKYIPLIGNAEEQYINCRLLELLDGEPSNVMQKIELILNDKVDVLTDETLAEASKKAASRPEFLSVIAKLLIISQRRTIFAMKNTSNVPFDEEAELAEIEKIKHQIMDLTEILEFRQADFEKRKAEYKAKKMEKERIRNQINEKTGIVLSLINEINELRSKISS